MSAEWKMQVRINLRADFAKVARADMSDPALKPLTDILAKYDADIKNQFDAFSDFCRAAEREAAQENRVMKALRFLKIRKGPTDTPLYRWTKDTIEKPGKEQQYATRFTIYADGGKEVYDQQIGRDLIKDLEPLMRHGMIQKVTQISADPAKNPQPPKRFL